MTNPYGEPEQGDERPQPRYGAYSPRPEGSEEASGEQSSTGGQSAQGGQHNPYGEPSWGQPGGDAGPREPSGQPGPYGAAPSWGQPSGGTQPDYQQARQAQPVAYPGGAVAQKPKRPLTLVLAMVSMLAAAGLSLIWGIYVLVTLQAQDAREMLPNGVYDQMVAEFENDPQLQQELQNQDLQDIDAEQMIDITLQVVGLFALVWAAILFAIYLTLAFVGTMTGNVGRVLATIWLAASVLFLLLSHNGASFMIIVLTVVASYGALVLLWLPASNDFVRQRRAFKEAQRRSSYSGYPGGPGGQGDPSGGGPGGGHPGYGQQAGQTGPGPNDPYGNQPVPYDPQSNPYGQDPRAPQ